MGSRLLRDIVQLGTRGEECRGKGTSRLKACRVGVGELRGAVGVQIVSLLRVRLSHASSILRIACARNTMYVGDAWKTMHIGDACFGQMACDSRQAA